MKIKKLIALAMAVSLLLLAVSASAQVAGKKPADWREDYAYHLGMQAYIFSYPWIYLPEVRYLWVVGNEPKNHKLVMYAALNHFWHAQNIMTSDYQDGGAPNNDTMYSETWMDVGKEPIILSHPDMGDRYFTFEITSMTSDNFGYVGARTTGSKAGNFAIVGPNWKGKLPPDVKSIAPSDGTKGLAKSTPYIVSPTNTVLMLGRTAVMGSKDVAAVRKLQTQYKLTPLSQWGKAKVTVPENRDVWKPYDRKTDSLAEWKTINRAMTEDPPLAQNAAIVAQFKDIGVGPGQDVTKMDEATKRGLARAAKDGRALMTRIEAAGGYGRKVNGWAVPAMTIGSAGYLNDFTTRGALQCMEGLIANDPEEAIYPNTHGDSDGNELNGANNYTLTFASGKLPDVKYFWSLTLYDDTNNLVKNPINRWAISSNSGGYKLAADGSLTLYVQNESPGKDKESNWLPAPSQGKFWVILRTYGPGKSLLDGTWEIPPLTKVK